MIRAFEGNDLINRICQAERDQLMTARLKNIKSYISNKCPQSFRKKRKNHERENQKECKFN